MFRQDIFAIIDKRVEGLSTWTFFVCSKKGADALVDAGGLRPPPAVSSSGYVNLSKFWRTSDEKLGRKVYDHLANLNAEDVLDFYLADIPFHAAALNAEHMAIEHHRRVLDQRVADYFVPLFDAAIEARDKRQISELIDQFPAGVDKAFMIDRIIYATKDENGADVFPELREPGVTLANWYKS
jgi:hypothetical protein